MKAVCDCFDGCVVPRGIHCKIPNYTGKKVFFIPNLDPKSGDFTDAYREAFKRIVMNDEDPTKVVKELGGKIRQMFKERK